MSKNLTIIVLIALLLVGGVLIKSQLDTIRDLKEIAADYKQTMIENATLIEVEKGRYSKLVDDMNTQKDLNNYLKKENEDLWRKNKNKEIVVVGSIDQSFEKRVDTVWITESERASQKYVSLYPNEEEWFIKHSLQIKDSTKISEWDFSDLKLNLVVNEKSKGMYEAVIDGPDFMKISRLDVKTLPLENIKKKRFGWVVGGSVDKSVVETNFNAEVYGGIRIDRTNLFLKLGSDVSDVRIGVGMLHEVK